VNLRFFFADSTGASTGVSLKLKASVSSFEDALRVISQDHHLDDKK
jgi:hypothetical protein